VESCTHADHKITHAAGDVCDFEVNFTETFCDTLKPNDRIIVYYNAMLNRNAVIGGAGNENKTKLEYGEANRVTSEDKTTTYTFSIDIIKTDSTNKLIDGAKFKVYDAPTGGNEVRVVWLRDEADGTKVYRRARADELTGAEIEVVKGKAVVLGFDNGIYYLEETKAPDGYNKLTSRKEFTIADGNLDAIFNEGIYSTGSGVHVVNKTGSMLPETGGMGTMLFISCGAAVVLGAGVLLVTKKRMSMIQE
jgi:LPXTG-motif cell wall-anchored protein